MMESKKSAADVSVICKGLRPSLPGTALSLGIPQGGGGGDVLGGGGGGEEVNRIIVVFLGKQI